MTDQFCIISSTIIQCCGVKKSNGKNLFSSPSLETFRLSVQSVYPMFNAGSMPHRLNKANFRLFIVLSALRRILSNYLPTGLAQVANISNGTRPHVSARERIGDSSDAFRALCMTK